MKLNTQQTLINTSDIQGDPLDNPPIIIIDDIRDITLEPCVGPHMVTNTSAPQVVHPNPSSNTPGRVEKSIKGDSNFHRALISKYLRHLRPLMAEIDVWSRLVIVVVSMNHLRPPI